MKRLCLVALMGLLALTSCDKSRKDQLQEFGLLGQHDLRRIEQATGVDGYDRSFFLGIGSLSWSSISKRKLRFYWGRTTEELFSTMLPYSHFHFIIDEHKTVPTVEFVFDEDWINSRRRIYIELEKSNLNWWLDDDRVRNRVLRAAVIRISRKDLENEIYIPR